jgi:hypothetical protein
MREEIFCVAKNPFQAKGIITRIRALGIPPNNVVVASRPSEVEETSRPGSRIFHDAKFGFAAGVAAGWFLSTAIVVMIGTPAMKMYLALLLLIGGAIGGAVLGTVLAATGVFETSRIGDTLEHHYQDEVARGGVLIAIECDDKAERSSVMSAIGYFGASDVHDSSGMAA